MAEENKPNTEEKMKQEKKPEAKPKVEKETKKASVETSKEKAPAKETKKETKKEEKPKKEMVSARSNATKISPKQSFAICKMIRGKTPDRAVEMLENVIKGRQPVKMPTREVAHQKGKGIAGAKFPKNAAEAFIPLVKQLKANAQSLGVGEPVISIAMANKAGKVFRKGGKQAKRTNIVLEAVSKNKFKKKKK
jgi:ribosomal protein L22